MNGITCPWTRMVYLDGVKELGLKLSYPSSFVHWYSKKSMKTWVISGPIGHWALPESASSGLTCREISNTTSDTSDNALNKKAPR